MEKRRTTGYFYFGLESKDNDDGKRPVRSKGSSLDNLYNEILPDVCEKGANQVGYFPQEAWCYLLREKFFQYHSGRHQRTIWSPGLRPTLGGESSA